MSEINVLSLNVRGVREGSKRREVYRWLKRYYNGNKHFVFMQETHSQTGDENIWQQEWGSKIIFSHGTNEARGVCILLPFEYQVLDIEKTWVDAAGRIAMIRIKFENESYTLINVYAPTKNNLQDQLEFLNILKTLVLENDDSSLILGGDFNTYLNPFLDKANTIHNAVSKYGKNLLQLMEDYELIDIWQVLNPTVKRFTWRQKNPFLQSR